jgi:hypothetical protein
MCFLLCNFELSLSSFAVFQLLVYLLICLELAARAHSFRLRSEVHQGGSLGEEKRQERNEHRQPLS